MDSRRKWMAGSIGAALLGLTLWGCFGGGTAAELFPEKKRAAPRAAAAEPVQEEPEKGNAVMKYDAAKYIRTKPLRDPFRLEEPLPEAAGKETVRSPAAVPAAGLPQPKERPLPVLQGILIAGGKKRAMVEEAGRTKTVTEGEQVGPWTVIQISKRSVVLSGGGGETTLTI